MEALIEYVTFQNNPQMIIVFFFKYVRLANDYIFIYLFHLLIETFKTCVFFNKLIGCFNVL